MLLKLSSPWMKPECVACGHFFFFKKRFLDSKTLLCQNDVHETELMRARTADFHVFTVLKAVIIFKRL